MTAVLLHAGDTAVALDPQLQVGGRIGQLLLIPFARMGRPRESRSRALLGPQLVLEVIATNPLLDKRHVYDGFGVPEVWLWRDGGFEPYRRRPDGGYDRIERSQFLPELDFALAAQFVTREDQDAALREFADAVGRAR